MRFNDFYVAYDGDIYEHENHPDHDLDLVDEVIVMQYTGLQDEKNNYIYEGDIVSCQGGYEVGDGCESHRLVFWDEDLLQFSVSCECHNDVIPLYEFDIAEVIGNYYENPELLDTV